MTKKLRRIASIFCAVTVITSVITVTTSTSNAQVTYPKTMFESTNTYLKEIRGIELDVEFNKDVREYEAISVIPATVDSIEIEAIPEDPTSEVSIRGANNLREGLNTISISVIAESGTTMNYRIYAYKDEQDEPSSNANLVSISGIKLNELFDKERLEYTAVVAADTNKVDIVATTEDPAAIVRIDKSYLSMGDNTINISVTAQDYTKKNYTIKVNRGSVSSNTNIISITGVELDYEYSNDMVSYTAAVPNSVTSLDLGVVTEDKNARVAIKGNTNRLEVGRNQIQITVTAQSGRRKIVYLTVDRQRSLILSGDASLSEIYGDFKFKESFNPNRLNYTIELDKSNKGIEEFIVEAGSTESSVEVKGRTARGARIPIRFDSEYNEQRMYSISKIPKGNSTITIKVSAPDGTKKTYTIKVIKA